MCSARVSLSICVFASPPVYTNGRTAMASTALVGSGGLPESEGLPPRVPKYAEIPTTPVSTRAAMMPTMIG